MATIPESEQQAPINTPKGGGGRARRNSKGGGPQPYDFRRPTKLSREHARTLQIVFETFARQYATQLTSTLRAVATVHLVTVEQLTYDEYIATLNNPTIMNLLTVEPLPGAGVLELSMGAGMLMVEHLLGGHGGVPQPERPLSEIEMSLLRGLLERALGELGTAFESIVPLDLQMIGVEYNPQFLQAATASEMVLVATFEQHIGEHESMVTVSLPFTPIFNRLEAMAGQQVQSERERLMRMAARLAMTERLSDVPLEVAVRFSPTQVASGELAALQVGDVLPLSHALAAPLTVSAADVVFAHAVPGSSGKRLACLVIDPPHDDSRR